MQDLREAVHLLCVNGDYDTGTARALLAQGCVLMIIKYQTFISHLDRWSTLTKIFSSSLFQLGELSIEPVFIIKIQDPWYIRSSLGERRNLIFVLNHAIFSRIVGGQRKA